MVFEKQRCSQGEVQGVWITSSRLKFVWKIIFGPFFSLRRTPLPLSKNFCWLVSFFKSCSMLIQFLFLISWKNKIYVWYCIYPWILLLLLLLFIKVIFFSFCRPPLWSNPNNRFFWNVHTDNVKEKKGKRMKKNY